MKIVRVLHIDLAAKIIDRISRRRTRMIKKLSVAYNRLYNLLRITHE